MGCEIFRVYRDHGVSGPKGRDKRPQFDALCRDVLVAQGNLPEALKSFRDALAIRDRLAKADPGDSGWQRDLSVSHAKLASVFTKTGEKAKAIDALRQGRAIMERLIKLSPDNNRMETRPCMVRRPDCGTGATTMSAAVLRHQCKAGAKFKNYAQNPGR
jgi:hypothetical protein